MAIVLRIVHVVSCAAMVGFILIQAGRGAQMGGTFAAGASQTLFGTVGRKDMMARITLGIFAVYVLSAILLAKMPTTGSVSSVADAIVEQESQVPAAPAQP
jgi:preprotein translocase subunit SecG